MTEGAGATRDVPEGSLKLDGLTVVLSDNAGLRSGAGRIESRGIVRAERALREGLPAEFICIGLAGAISELSLSTGEDETEDLLSANFAKF